MEWSFPSENERPVCSQHGLRATTGMSHPLCWNLFPTRWGGNIKHRMWGYDLSMMRFIRLNETQWKTSVCLKALKDFSSKFESVTLRVIKKQDWKLIHQVLNTLFQCVSQRRLTYGLLLVVRVQGWATKREHLEDFEKSESGHCMGTYIINGEDHRQQFLGVKIKCYKGWPWKLYVIHALLLHKDIDICLALICQMYTHF